MNKKFRLTLLSLAATLTMSAAPSILDIKHSITDDNIVPPESFETKTRELEENFYLQNFVVSQPDRGGEKLGTAKEYEKRLAALPTTIEMPYNDIVGKFINMYLGKRRGLVADMLALHSYYGNIFIEELEKEGMPLELQYLPVIESALNPNAVSRAGAAGLWQFMPATAKGLGMEINSLVDERRDPRSSSRNAARLLHQFYNIYGDWSLAIAAYNCGPGNVNKAMRRAGGGKKDFWEIYNYLPSETRGYVPAFIAANYVMNYYNKHNIAPTVVKRHLTTDTVTVNHRIHFNQIAEVLNIPISELRMLNPQFRKDVIPGTNHPYKLTLPTQQCLSYLMSEDAILKHDADLYAQRTYVEPGLNNNETAIVVDETGDRNIAATERQSTNAEQNMELAMVTDGDVTTLKHTVGRGESLKDIAKRYNVSATDIKRWNKLRRGKVKEGDILTIEQRAAGDLAAVTTTVAKTPARTSTSEVPEPRRQTRETTQAPVPERRREVKKEQPQVPAPATRNDNNKRETAKRETAKKETAKKENTRTDNKKQNKKQTAQNTSKNKKDKQNKKQTQAKSKKYEVKSGDSLEKIAKRNGVTVDELRAANGIKKGNDRIQIGQSLNIPGKKNGKGSSKNSKKKNRR